MADIPRAVRYVHITAVRKDFSRLLFENQSSYFPAELQWPWTKIHKAGHFTIAYHPHSTTVCCNLFYIYNGVVEKWWKNCVAIVHVNFHSLHLFQNTGPAIKPHNGYSAVIMSSYALNLTYSMQLSQRQALTAQTKWWVRHVLVSTRWETGWSLWRPFICIKQVCMMGWAANVLSQHNPIKFISF